MPQATVDPAKCDPDHCTSGICAVKGNCPVKGIIQPDRGEPPIVDWSRCRGCSLCVARCPLKAIHLE
jgi:Pyruvate/2-oxoacid:ferredoxin oxidoreductase delta subunit